MRRLVAVLVLASALVAACTGDEPGPTPTATAEATPTSGSTVVTPSPTAPPTGTAELPGPSGPRRTGDAALDAIVEAVEARDVEALLGLVEPVSEECRIDPDMTWHPQCEDGEPEGTSVSGLLQGACEGRLNRDTRAVVESFLDGVQGFWAAVSVGDTIVYPWREPDTLLVFHRPILDQDRQFDLAVYLQVRDGRVIGVGAACAGPLEELLRPGRTVIAGPWDHPYDSYAPRRTGDAALDAIVEAVEARDVEALLGLVRMQVEECLPEGVDGIGGPPRCAALGVPEGTEVTFAYGASCEGYAVLDPRPLVERLVESQDGLYAAVRADTDHLLFHGHLGTPGAVWVADGGIEIIQLGCVTPVETRPAFLRGEVIAGPWPERATPYGEGVARLVRPVLAEVEAGDVSALWERSQVPFFVHSCGDVPRDPEAAYRAFLDASPVLYGVYQRSAIGPSSMQDVWWLLWETEAGPVRLELRTPQQRLTELMFGCGRPIAELATSSGVALPRIELSSE